MFIFMYKVPSGIWSGFSICKTVKCGNLLNASYLRTMLHLTVSQSFVKSKLPFWLDGLFYAIFDDVQFWIL